MIKIPGPRSKARQAESPESPRARIGEVFLRCAAITAFIGAGLQALLGDFPLRTLLWDQSWWNWFAEAAGFSWTEWVTSLSVDRSINLLSKLLGGLLLLSGGLLLWFRHGTRAKTVLAVGSLILLLRSFLIWKEHFWQIGQLMEMFILVGSPLLYLFWARGAENDAHAGHDARWQLIVLRLLIALTFTGHGFYAVGIHPVPANFVFMTQSGLGVGEDTARQILLAVGGLDFLAAGLLLLPWPRAWSVALAWVIPWAVLTTFARVWSYGGYVGTDTLIFQWIPEMVVRLPHILLPLALFFRARPRDAGPVEG